MAALTADMHSQMQQLVRPPTVPGCSNISPAMQLPQKLHFLR